MTPSTFQEHLRRDELLPAVLLGLFCSSLDLPNAAAEAAAAESSPKPAAAAPQQLHLFLLVGQSNMAGRGQVEPADRVPIPHVFSLDAHGEWVPAVDPLHWDKPIAGVGLARSFAVEYLKRHPGANVGFIPAACGGSPISTWLPGAYFDGTSSHPYDDALARARKALSRGTLKGILWHQGESDRSPSLAPHYEAALTDLIGRFRRELQAPGVPFVIGQLGQFAGAGPWDASGLEVDRAQRSVAVKVPFSAFVSSDQLTSHADNLHFDAASLREFGKRYAAAFASIETGAQRGAAHEPAPAKKRQP
jgi:hypothetical protein